MSRKKSQKQNVIDHLVKHGSITPLEALNLYGIFRLGAIIHTLRHSNGMHINTKIADGYKNYAIYIWGEPDKSVMKTKEEKEKDKQDELFDMQSMVKKIIWPD